MRYFWTYWTVYTVLSIVSAVGGQWHSRGQRFVLLNSTNALTNTLCFQNILFIFSSPVIRWYKQANPTVNNYAPHCPEWGGILQIPFSCYTASIKV